MEKAVGRYPAPGAKHKNFAQAEFFVWYNHTMPNREPADAIDEVLLAWKPGHFEPRELSQAAMLAAGINPPYIDISLEALAADLIENDDRPS